MVAVGNSRHEAEAVYGHVIEVLASESRRP
jgi:hypothetical protein